jgi:hypothetical protein
LTAVCVTAGPREPGAAAREDTQLADGCHGARACDSGHARPNGAEQEDRGADGVARTTRIERAACAVATSGNVLLGRSSSDGTGGPRGVGGERGVAPVDIRRVPASGAVFACRSRGGTTGLDCAGVSGYPGAQESWYHHASLGVEDDSPDRNAIGRPWGTDSLEVWIRVGRGL